MSLKILLYKGAGLIGHYKLLLGCAVFTVQWCYTVKRIATPEKSNSN